MNGEKIFKTSLIIFFFIGIATMFCSQFFTEKVPSHFDKCYDKNSNEIIGQTCFVENGYKLASLGICLLVIGSILMLSSELTLLFMEGVV